MFTVKRTEFGYHLTLSGTVNVEDVMKWLEESKQLLSSGPKSFGVFVDMRDIKPLSRLARKQLEEGQLLYKQHGMTRSVVIVSSPIIRRQFEDLAKETGIYEWERYIDASATPNWEQVGMDWLLHAYDPDARNRPARNRKPSF